jgi:hypothetical protein
MRLVGLLVVTCLSINTHVIAQTPVPSKAPLKVRLEFRIKPEELKELHVVLSRFAEAERLTVNDIGAQMPPRHGRPLFYLELHQGDAIQVTVTNIRAENRMFVWFYQFQPGSNLKDIESKLEEILRRQWPTLAPYEGS